MPISRWQGGEFSLVWIGEILQNCRRDRGEKAESYANLTKNTQTEGFLSEGYPRTKKITPDFPL